MLTHTIVSLSIKTVFCISATVLAIVGSVSRSLLNTRPTFLNKSLMPLPSAPTKIGTIYIAYPGLLSLNSNEMLTLDIWYTFSYVSFPCLLAVGMPYHKTNFFRLFILEYQGWFP